MVITGGTKGVGRSLAEKFIRSGDNVAICSRDKDRVQSTVQELQDIAQTIGIGENTKVIGLPTDITKAEDVSSFAAYAREQLGTVDLWINNAGTNAYTFKPLMEQSDQEIVSVVETNIGGTLLCCKAAINIMKTQSQGGHIFNMDGAGTDGGATPRFAAYGATKRSLPQLNASIAAELQFAGVKNVKIHMLSPGMVTTELLMAGADNKVSKFFINCLAEEPQAVADFLVPRIRSVPEMYKGNSLAGMLPGGQYIRFLTKAKAYGQIAKRLLSGERKGRFVSED